MAMKDIEFHTTLMLGRLRSYQLTRPTVCIAPNEYAELVQIGDVVKVIALNDRFALVEWRDRKSTRLNSSHVSESRMPSSASKKKYCHATAEAGQPGNARRTAH